MDTDRLLSVLDDTVDAVALALASTDDWGLAGTRDGQYRSDLAADRAALAVLLGSGLGVLSEESGVTAGDRRMIAVVDPLDGSTNAARGIPWYATSICVLDDAGPLVAVVADQARGKRWRAVRGEGATVDGEALRTPSSAALGEAVVASSGLPPTDPPWRQTRILGAAALDLCAVAGGVVDGFVDCVADAHGAWDYMGGLLVCREAGAAVADAAGRDLVVRTHEARRTPVAATSAALLVELVRVRGLLPA